MNANVLDKLTYGLFILTSKKKSKATGCIVDTCIQVGTNPDRILVSVQNSNYTRKIIDKSGVFCIAILDEDCPFELIKHFGFQSGRDVDKFEGLTTFDDYYGVPCVLSHVCAAISAKVIDSVNIGSHTIFIGNVKEVKDISDKTPMTYSYYLKHIQPRTEEDVAIDNMKKESDDHGGASHSTYGAKSDERCDRRGGACKNSYDRYDSETPVGFTHDFIDEHDGDEDITGWRCTICGCIYPDKELPNDFTCGVCGHPSTDFIAICEEC